MPKIDLLVVSSIREWLHDNHVIAEGIEECGSHPLGFGGRIDLHGRWGVSQKPFTLDFKSQGKPYNKIRFYPEMAIQLSANAAIAGKLDGDLVSFIFSTVEPGSYKTKIWGDNHYWFQRFLNRFLVWKDENKYEPLA